MWVRTPLTLSVVEGDLDIFRFLLEKGADLNAFGPGDGETHTSGARDGETALSAAARLSRATMLRELLDHGADPKLNDSAAVASAAEAGDIEGMMKLIEHGGDIHIQQGEPGKALHAAARKGNTDMVKFLLSRGVDVNASSGKYGYAKHTQFQTLLGV